MRPTFKSVLAVTLLALVSCSDEATGPTPPDAVPLAANPFTAGEEQLATVPSEETLAGPETIARGRGGPDEFSIPFEIDPFEAYEAFYLVVEPAEGLSNPTAAWIEVDGEEIVGPDAFNARTLPEARIEIFVEAAGQIDVRIAGRPGSGMRVSLVGKYRPGWGRVGPGGGTVLHPDGMQYTIPPGGLDGDVVVQIETLPMDIDPEAQNLTPTFAVRFLTPGGTAPAAAAARGPEGAPVLAIPPWVFKAIPHLIHIDLSRGLQEGEYVQVNATANLDGPTITGAHVADRTVDEDREGVTARVNGVSPAMPNNAYQVEVKSAVCSSDALYELLERDPATSGDVPIVYIHGWQPHETDCDAWTEDFNAEEQGSAVLSHLSDLHDQIAFHRFTYPSFNPVGNAGAFLADALVEAFPDRDDIILVGHSMGGLVARSALTHPGLEDRVARTITLGTPHLGSPLASPSHVAAKGIEAGLARECVIPDLKPSVLDCQDGLVVALGLVFVDLETAGAQDLVPEDLGGSFIPALPPLSGPEELHQFAGQLGDASDLVPCGGSLASCLAYRTQLRLFGIDGLVSDAVVPLSSAFGVPGAQRYESHGEKYDHSELARGNWIGARHEDPDPLLTEVAELVAEAIMTSAPLPYSEDFSTDPSLTATYQPKPGEKFFWNASEEILEIRVQEEDGARKFAFSEAFEQLGQDQAFTVSVDQRIVEQSWGLPHGMSFTQGLDESVGMAINHSGTGRDFRVTDASPATSAYRSGQVSLNTWYTITVAYFGNGTADIVIRERSSGVVESEFRGVEFVPGSFNRVAYGVGTIHRDGRAAEIHYDNVLVRRGADPGGGPLSLLETFEDGDYTSDPAWRFRQTPGAIERGTATTEVIDGTVEFLRVGAGGRGGGQSLTTPVSTPITDDLRYEFDVRVMSHSLPGCGVGCTEYPFYTVLAMSQPNGVQDRLVFAYSTNGGFDRTQPRPDGGVWRWVVRSDAPPGVWLRDQNFRIRDYNTTAVTIDSVRIAANGWDHHSFVDNVELPAVTRR